MYDGVEKRQKVRMLELRRCFDFSQESLGAESGAEVFMENFDCHVAIVTDGARKEHRRHSTLADLALDDVPICREAREWPT